MLYLYICYNVRRKFFFYIVFVVSFFLRIIFFPSLCTLHDRFSNIIIVVRPYWGTDGPLINSRFLINSAMNDGSSSQIWDTKEYRNMETLFTYIIKWRLIFTVIHSKIVSLSLWTLLTLIIWIFFFCHKYIYASRGVTSSYTLSNGF